MALQFENARLTDDDSNGLYNVLIADGNVRRIVPLQSEGAQKEQAFQQAELSRESEPERIDLNGAYLGK